jgi:hypothetical protein
MTLMGNVITFFTFLGGILKRRERTERWGQQFGARGEAERNLKNGKEVEF